MKLKRVSIFNIPMFVHGNQKFKTNLYRYLLFKIFEQRKKTFSVLSDVFMLNLWVRLTDSRFDLTLHRDQRKKCIQSFSTNFKKYGLKRMFGTHVFFVLLGDHILWEHFWEEVGEQRRAEILKKNIKHKNFYILGLGCLGMFGNVWNVWDACIFCVARQPHYMRAVLREGRRAEESWNSHFLVEILKKRTLSFFPQELGWH